MGWAESPAYFCAATETGRDIIQGLVANETHLPPLSGRISAAGQSSQTEPQRQPSPRCLRLR
jgi:hypothetical protein